MKKIKYLCFLAFLFFCGNVYVSASPYFSLVANKGTVIVGNTVRITVKINGIGNSQGKVGAWSYCIDYDETVFTLTDSTSRDQGSKACIRDGAYGVTSASETFTFKAKKSGSSAFTIAKASVSDYDTELPMQFTKKSISIRAKTQAEIEASYSTNANLRALKVVDYEITPVFNKDILEYNLEVENDVEKINIKATKADNAASITGAGEKELSEGLNKFSIVVTAEKGNKKTYVINVTRKELNPIKVDIDGFEYTIVRKSNVLETPTYYTSTEIEVDGEKVPAFTSDITGFTLVGLKDGEGNIDLYRYSDGDYQLYKQIGSDGLVFIPLTADSVLKGYDRTKNITINNTNLKVYFDSDNNDYVMIYGMNAATGKIAWYRYDTVEGTFQRYIEKIVNKQSDKNMYFILTIIFGGVSGLSLLIILILVSTNSKIKNKNDKLISMLQALRDSKKSTEEKKDIVLLREAKKKEVQQSLRKRQEEFLETGENEIVRDDVELEEIPSEKKTKRVRKKKEE